DNGGILSSETPTFAHAFSAAGYETVLCGRMHFNGPDQYHGFDKRIHGDAGGRSLTPEILGSGQNRTNGQTHYAVEVSGYGKNGFQAFDRSVTNTACDYIQANHDRPFLLVIGLMLPHNPLICEKELFDYYYNQIPPIEPEPETYIENIHPAIRLWRERRGIEKLSPEQNRRALAAYCGLVTELDRNVGSIQTAMDTANKADNTVFAYCSDHGDMASEHGLWWKSNFYDGSARIPLIVSHPDTLPKGQTRDCVSSLTDVGPTLLDLAHLDTLPDVSGRSLAAVLSSGLPTDTPHDVFCEYMGLLGDQPACMIRSKNWKLNYYSEFDSCQLFNLESDPTERNDLARDPACQQIVKELKEKIDARWSAASMSSNLGKQHRARQLIRAAGDKHKPPVESFISSAHDNAFDFSQLET
ncbi:MAG: sulfatase-like hydrolase/transferase, partial [Candidatus Latescibacteria bacterium]|nr:sulfatase-like hydrolase/transferase [Candidatus Latescibacterota bacterium]